MGGLIRVRALYLGNIVHNIFFSLKINAGIKLCVIDFTNGALWNTSIYVFQEDGKSYAVIASIKGTFLTHHRMT